MASSSSANNVASCSVLLLLLFSLAASSVIEKRTRLCGKDLVQTLESLCLEFFDPAQKRHTGHQQITLPPMLSTWVDEPRMGFLDAETALQLLRPASHRPARGIVEECCHNSCSLADLLSYCGQVRPSNTDK